MMERLQAMRSQEVRYGCVGDFTKPLVSAPKRPRPGVGISPCSSLVDLLDECASLVDDSITKSPKRGAAAPVAPPKSPSSVRGMLGSGEQGTGAGISSALDSKNSETAEEVFHTNYELSAWRLQMFDWACMVVDGFQMDRNTVLATAFDILDRYTVCELKRPDSPPITREDYQLFAMTSVYIAVKVLEPFPRKLGLDALKVMSRDFYTPEDITRTELEILSALKWRTTPPTAVGFCRELVPFLFPSGTKRADLEQVYSTICDVSVSDPSFLGFSSSIIASGALLHAARLTGFGVRERTMIKKQAIGVLGIDEKRDSKELADLEMVYSKMEKLYC